MTRWLHTASESLNSCDVLEEDPQLRLDREECVVAHTQMPRGHTARNHKRTESSNQRLRNHPHGCIHGHGARLWKQSTTEPEIRLATPKQEQNKNICQSSRVTNNITWLSAFSSQRTLRQQQRETSLQPKL